MVFRFVDEFNFYFIEISQMGYELGKFDKGEKKILYTLSTTVLLGKWLRFIVTAE